MAVAQVIGRAISSVISALTKDAGLDSETEKNPLNSEKFPTSKKIDFNKPTPQDISDQFKLRFNMDTAIQQSPLSTNITSKPLFRLGVEYASHMMERDALVKLMGKESYDQEAQTPGTRAYRIEKRVNRISSRFKDLLDDTAAADFKFKIEDISLEKYVTNTALERSEWVGLHLAAQLSDVLGKVAKALPVNRFVDAGNSLINAFINDPTLAKSIPIPPFAEQLIDGMKRSLRIGDAGKGNCQMGIRFGTNLALGMPRGSFKIMSGDALEGFRRFKNSKYGEKFIYAEVEFKDVSKLPVGTYFCCVKPGGSYDIDSPKPQRDRGHVMFQLAPGVWSSNAIQNYVNPYKLPPNYKVHVLVPKGYLNSLLAYDQKKNQQIASIDSYKEREASGVKTQ